MSRLLHAAARGARIQTKWNDSVVWQTDNQFLFIDTMRHYRIHPDDAHLAYGPISTALREMAEDHGWNLSWQHRVAHAAADDFSVKFHGEPDYPLFYLILAECLADEGM